MELDFNKVDDTASAETVADFRAWYKGRTGNQYAVGDDRLALEIPLRIADMLPVAVTDWPFNHSTLPLPTSVIVADRHCDAFYKAKYAAADSGQTFNGNLTTVQYLAKRLELTTPAPVAATPADTAQLAPTTSADYLTGFKDGCAASIVAIQRLTP